MDRLWSPWRLAYVTSTERGSGCIFCDAREAPSSDGSLCVFRSAHAYVILNLYPYNSGHLMVVPNRHVGALGQAAPDELSDLMRLLRLAELALVEAYQPHGLNVGINLGKAAGAGVLEHLHIHIVPRWDGDTNFMTVVGETRILPEHLTQAAARLRPIFERLAGS